MLRRGATNLLITLANKAYGVDANETLHSTP